MSDWISIDDKFKQENGSTVLVSWEAYGKHGGYIVASVWNGAFMDSHGHYIRNPTHWMSLPEPPQQ